MGIEASSVHRYGARVQIDSQQREIAIKLVYYGPPMSGKTTNLKAIHQMTDPDHSGKLTVLNTADDRTLFFDLLPIMARMSSGVRVRLNLYTVPGQVIHAATRRLVLSGADGVAFVADSRRSMAKTNSEFWHGMMAHLTENDIDPERIPIVLQFNKRDLPDIRTREELEAIERGGKHKVFFAVATQGEGVVETVTGLIREVFKDLQVRHHVESRFQFDVDELIQGVLGATVAHAGRDRNDVGDGL